MSLITAGAHTLKVYKQVKAMTETQGVCSAAVVLPEAELWWDQGSMAQPLHCIAPSQVPL